MNSNILNTIGLVIDIIGALLMYFNTQPVNYQTYIYRREELKGSLYKKAKKKNQKIKLGAFLLFVGFFIQIIATWF